MGSPADLNGLYLVKLVDCRPAGNIAACPRRTVPRRRSTVVLGGCSFRGYPRLSLTRNAVDTPLVHY